MKVGSFILVTIVCFVACSDSEYRSVENVVDLSISFSDPIWDGKKVPKRGQCTNCQGEGLSPPMLISNIPEKTDFLIVEYKDKTMGVFHGAIRFQVSGKGKFSTPSIREQTFKLPQGVEVEAEHTAPIGSPGAYMAPCGCGYNNKYSAVIPAVQSLESGQKLLLGKGKINLGRF